jgi:hypothetical protein
MLRFIWLIRRDLVFLMVGRRPCPQWDATRGELRMGGRILKRIVVGKAIRVVTILDEFESTGWSDPVAIEEDDRLDIHQTLKSLNKNLTGVRFRANGQGDVLWEIAE